MDNDMESFMEAFVNSAWQKAGAPVEYLGYATCSTSAP